MHCALSLILHFMSGQLAGCKQDEIAASLALQVWLVAADCIFIGLAPVLVHMAKNADGKYSFHPVAINLMVECAKLVFATATLLVNVRKCHG